MSNADAVTAPGDVAVRLAAPEPTWSASADVVVVGSGVAGLTAALGAVRAGKRVLVLTKGQLGEGSTGWAQGGIAAALAPGDSPERHLRDTLEAGAGLGDGDAARGLVETGPHAVRRLAELGAAFDRSRDAGPPNAAAQPGARCGPRPEAGEGYAFTREGGHSLPRVLHAGGDATGREVQRTLEAALRGAGGVGIVEHAFALDLLRAPGGTTAGVTVACLDRSGAAGSVGTVYAPAVVLATGGLGQLFATTTNPEVATGDGIALALRGGAEVADLEFVQFHPTALVPAGRPQEQQGETEAATGPRLLISEALRGEGATLVDATGAPVMAGQHPRADLAPRDVVAHAIARRMSAAPGGLGDRVYLDARPLGAQTLTQRFPTVMAACRAAGIDPVAEPIPVAPAAHYSCGGVRVDPFGRSTVPGLYAIGEAACTGAHGANRLASNSLLEGLVMGELVAGELARPAAPAPRAAPPVTVPPGPTGAPAAPGEATPGGQLPAGIRGELTAAMSRYAGVIRDADGLAQAGRILEGLAPARTRAASGHAGAPQPPSRASWEATNLHTLATLLVASASAREESRGCHVRTDHPEPRTPRGEHLVSRLTADGTLSVRQAGPLDADATAA